MRWLPRTRTRIGGVGIWLGTWLLSTAVLLTLGLLTASIAFDRLDAARPCWDFDPADHGINWPIERPDVERLDLSPSDREEILRWLDGGCTEDTGDVLGLTLGLIGTAGFFVSLGGFIPAGYLAAVARRRSQGDH